MESVTDSADTVSVSQMRALPWWKGAVIYQIYPRSFLDTNGDGNITPDELKAGRDGKGSGPGGNRKPGERFDKADTNGDGKLTEEEVKAGAWARMKELDTDGDNAISKAEIAKRVREKMKGQGHKGGLMGRFDENKDEKLSESEVPAEVWAKVSKADTDADGLVSQAELREVMEKRGGKGGGAKGPKKPKATPAE